MASDSKGTAAAKQRSSRRVTWSLRNRPAGSPHPRTLDNLTANLGQVSTVAVQRLSTTLPWFSLTASVTLSLIVGPATLRGYAERWSDEGLRRTVTA